MRMSRSIVALLLVGCTSVAAAEPVATAACGPLEMPPVQAGLHLVGDAQPPVPYSSTPPSSGWHRLGEAGPGVASRPLPEPVQVGLLERGLVVVTHGPLSSLDSAALAAWADGRDDVAVTAYPRLGTGQVAAAAWGVVQRCDGLDLDALARFSAFYADPTDEHPAPAAPPAGTSTPS